MQYKQLGQSNLNISKICFGCEPLGGHNWGDVNFTEITHAVQAAVDAGINFFDTADIYGLGLSETNLAKALGSKRHELVIATKFGMRFENGTIYKDNRPSHIETAIDASLKRLKIEAIPLYQLHWHDLQTPISDIIETLVALKAKGKLKAIGVSNINKQQLLEAHAIHPIASLQIPFSLLDLEPALSLIPVCAEKQISILTYGSLAQGLLTGKYNASKTFADNDRRHRLPKFQKGVIEKHLQTVDIVKNIAQKYGKTAAQVSINWLIQHNIASVITGIKSEQQLHDNIAAIDWQLDMSDFQSLSRIAKQTSKKDYETI